MEIDPLETVITFLEAALTVVSGRVAGKHRYGAGWSESQTGVSVHLDDGTPELYANVSTCRFEIRIYANDQANILPVYQALIALSRANERFVVAITAGNALVHYFKPVSGLSMPYDDVLKMDVGVVFFEAMIAEPKIS